MSIFLIIPVMNYYIRCHQSRTGNSKRSSKSLGCLAENLFLLINFRYQWSVASFFTEVVKQR